MSPIESIATPLAYIVHTPVLDEYGNILCIGDVFEIEASAARFGFSSYTEPPERLLLPDTEIPKTEVRLRQENLRLLRQGAFVALHVSGGSISEYVRQLIRAAYESKTQVFAAVPPSGCLHRYLSWYEWSIR